MEEAEQRGLVFATDPTSAWACTIGGNIAENAGGKDCVLYGTCIDNLLSWRMAMPSGQTWTVARVDHPLRKILPDDEVAFEVRADDGAPPRRITLRGGEIRKKGLWKDITQKALGGVPGLQKEGTDGVITSAEFVLYPEYEAKRTLCLEFFGPDFDEASRVIVLLSRAFPFPDAGAETLSALEHFDDEYVRAIQYKTKAARAETPKAVLLVDVVGHDEGEVERGVAKVRGVLDGHRNTELFAARDAAEAKRFWADRKKLGAIARRTNAFKMNEDVVLPLDALAEFARWVEAVNVDEERFAQDRYVARAAEIVSEAAPPREDPERLAAKIPAALERCARARAAVAEAAPAELRAVGPVRALRADLEQLLRGFPAIIARARSRRRGDPRPARRARDAHARGRRERARERAGPLERPRDAAADRARHRPRDGAGDRARRRRLRRARHRRHQAQVPRARADRRAVARTGAAVDPGRAHEPGQARGPGRPRPGLHALVQPPRARGAHPPARAARGARASRSPTASAAASASRTAASTTRRAGCSSTRATRTSPSARSSRRSSTTRSASARTRFELLRGSRRSPTTARSATSA